MLRDVLQHFSKAHHGECTIILATRPHRHHEDVPPPTPVTRKSGRLATSSVATRPRMQIPRRLTGNKQDFTHRPHFPTSHTYDGPVRSISATIPQRYLQRPAAILTTDDQGCITLKSSGKAFKTRAAMVHLQELRGSHGPRSQPDPALFQLQVWKYPEVLSTYRIRPFPAARSSGQVPAWLKNAHFPKPLT